MKTSPLWQFCKVFAGFVLIGIIAFIVGLFLFSLGSCSTERRAIKKISAIASRANDAARKACITMFPPEVSHDTVRDTKYLPGKVVEVPGIPVLVDCDSAIKKDPRIKRVTVPCPPSYYRVDTVKIETVMTITKRDVHKEQTLQKELSEAQEDNVRLKKGRNNWRWIGLGSLAVIVIGTGWKIFKGIKGGGLFKKA